MVRASIWVVAPLLWAAGCGAGPGPSGAEAEEEDAGGARVLDEVKQDPDGHAEAKPEREARPAPMVDAGGVRAMDAAIPTTPAEPHHAAQGSRGSVTIQGVQIEPGPPMPGAWPDDFLCELRPGTATLEQTKELLGEPSSEQVVGERLALSYHYDSGAWVILSFDEGVLRDVVLQDGPNSGYRCLIPDSGWYDAPEGGWYDTPDGGWF